MRSFKFLSSIAQPVKENKLCIICAVSLSAGILAGALLLRFGVISAEDTVSNYANSLQSVSFLKTLIQNAGFYTLYIIAAFFCGLCIPGFLFAAPLLFFRGLGLGTAAGALYLYLGGKGLAMGALGIALPCAVSSCILICAFTEASDLSLSLCKVFKKGTRCRCMHSELMRYSKLFLTYIAALCLCSVVGAGLNALTGKIFVF